MFTVKAYCAGIALFSELVPAERLEEFLKETKQRWEQQDIQVSFAGEKQLATEICIDIYDERGCHRQDLHVEYKDKFKVKIEDFFS